MTRITGDAVLWVKKRFEGAAIGDDFQVVGKEEVLEALKEVRLAKAGFSNATSGGQVNQMHQTISNICMHVLHVDLLTNILNVNIEVKYERTENK